MQQGFNKFNEWRGFSTRELSAEWRDKLTEEGRIGRGQILKMTTVSKSGHPGGSMSSLELYLVLYHMANVDPLSPYRDDRDRIIISHGHTSPGAYVALASAGFFDITPALHGFRQASSPFEGHVERSVPGIEWGTGNLGQGLSVGVGKAIYFRLSGHHFHTWVLMGDGEQQKGQIVEARRQAANHKLTNLTAIIDFNRLQISGEVKNIQPQDLKTAWETDGWCVLEIDGHNLNEIYAAYYDAVNYKKTPTLIIAHTVMGKGVSFMENDAGYHGAVLSADKLDAALEELGGIDNDLDDLLELRQQGPPPAFEIPSAVRPLVERGKRIFYQNDAKADNRGAFGKALVSVTKANIKRDDFHIAVFDCDLSKSVKTDGFEKAFPDFFYQFGIAEHATATTAGSLSAENALSVWADFGMFALAETYNQARLTDINHGNMKLFCTHSGVNVGEDGRTHQSLDYFGLVNSTFGWKLITPADPNQTDAIVRYVLATPGNFAVVMGRSAIPIITDKNDKPYFGEGYTYRYGRMELIRKGERVAIIAAGNILFQGMEAWSIMKQEGHELSLISISDWSDIHNDDLTMLSNYADIIVVEDHNVKTGLGALLATKLYDMGATTRMKRLGISDYVTSGKASDLYKLLHLDGASIAKTAYSIFEKEGAGV